jgi:DnaJ-class molecular chaperone
VAPQAAAGDIKKRYWRLSLLIHPDKCAHPQANSAFQAVSKAAKVLGDAGERRALDAQREDEELRKYAEQVGRAGGGGAGSLALGALGALGGCGRGGGRCPASGRGGHERPARRCA